MGRKLLKCYIVSKNVEKFQGTLAPTGSPARPNKTLMGRFTYVYYNNRNRARAAFCNIGKFMSPNADSQNYWINNLIISPWDISANDITKQLNEATNFPQMQNNIGIDIIDMSNNLIGSFDYVPDCAFNLFGKKNDSNISAVLAGRKKLHKGYVFEYKL